MDEYTIIERLSNGDERAMDEIYKLFAGHLLFIAKGIVKNDQEAEDILVQSFYKCWRKRDFACLKDIKSYLFVVTKHACFNVIKKRKTQDSRRQQMPESILGGGNEEYVLQRMIKAELMELVFSEIDRLPENPRKLLHFIYTDGMDMITIAEKLDITVQNARMKKCRALKQLREALTMRNWLN